MCNATVNVTTACIPPPAEVDTWTYHYFDFAPAENQRRAGAGTARARSHCSFVLTLAHFITELIR